MTCEKNLPCQAGRRVMKVSPYDKTGVCYESLEDVPEKARRQTSWKTYLTMFVVFFQLQVEAVNLIISPKIGVDVLNAMKKKGIRSATEMSLLFFVKVTFKQVLR